MPPPRKQDVAVVHSHNHVDHYGGVRGGVSQEDIDSGRDEDRRPGRVSRRAAVAENVFAGKTMSPPGVTTSSGTVTLIPPTEITETGQRMNIDGLDFEFQLAPDTEAPAETHWYIERSSWGRLPSRT